MQLDYLKGIRGNGALTYAGPERLVRLCRFEPSEAAALRKAMQELAEGVRTALRMEDLPFLQGNGYALEMRVVAEDDGLSTPDERGFRLALTKESFAGILRSMEPLCREGAHGHVWLTESPGGIALLLSTGGSW